MPHPARPPPEEDEVAALIAHIAAHATATEALRSWCAARLDPAPATIRATVLADLPLPHSRYSGALTLVPGETLRHRRVHLTWGSTVVSEAENWYLPDRLPDAIRRRLLTSDIPFGAAIQPLNPTRTTTGISRPAAPFILCLRATVTTHTQIAEVLEHYRSVLCGREGQGSALDPLGAAPPDPLP